MYCQVMFFVIMTAYNEEGPLARLLPALPRTVNGHELRTILVDDGSKDRTARVAEAHGCTVIRMPCNGGKGAALRAGLRSIQDEACDGIILMDSDGQHDPCCLAALIAPIVEGTADMVVGSRYLATAGRGSTPLNRYLVRTATVNSLRRFAGIEVTDPYCGFRAFTPEAMKCVSLCGNRYESELEMAFCVNRSGLRIAEIPIPRIYGDRTSKMGARWGTFLGRVLVVSGYARTIVREIRKPDTEPGRELARMVS